MSFDTLGKQQSSSSNYYSPRQFRQQPSQSSYSKPLNNINNILAYNQTHHPSGNLFTNKENPSTSSLAPQAEKTSVSPTKTTPTVAANEIIDAAQRILAKRQNNAEIAAAAANTSVKSMKSKFEDPNAAKNCTSNVTIHLTPKSIIKKFEQMTRDNSHT
jgi:hypothetical protein